MTATPKSAAPDVVEYRDCPFDTRLARTPYLVIPKLALQAMPMDWRDRLEALLCEADDLGMETPDYHVFRQGDGFSLLTRSDSEDPYSPISDLGVLRGDPWADYRRGSIRDVCPTFRGGSGNSSVAPQVAQPIREDLESKGEA